MRFLPVVLLVGLLCFSAEALKKRQLQQVHAGYCPMPMMICAIYCPPTSSHSIVSRQVNGCTSDSECNLDKKCCKPACGCTNKCVKSLENPASPKLP